VADDTKSRRLDVKPVERRTFLRYSLIGATSAGLGAFALASLDFLWPRPGDELTGEVPLENAEELAALINDTRAPVRVPAGGISIVTWDPSSESAMANYGEDHAIVNDSTGLMALYSQRCVHLGCAVPWCQTSQWFECPCHGSQYSRVGEHKGGPAPRGMDRFPAWLDGDTLIVNTGEIISGPPLGTNTTGQEAEGPHCV
jgi:cytochrome b6-f complex iron-sulfur subunit